MASSSSVSEFIQVYGTSSLSMENTNTAPSSHSDMDASSSRTVEGKGHRERLGVSWEGFYQNHFEPKYSQRFVCWAIKNVQLLILNIVTYISQIYVCS